MIGGGWWVIVGSWSWESREPIYWAGSTHSNHPWKEGQRCERCFGDEDHPRHWRPAWMNEWRRLPSHLLPPSLPQPLLSHQLLLLKSLTFSDEISINSSQSFESMLFWTYYKIKKKKNDINKSLVEMQKKYFKIFKQTLIVVLFHLI